MAKISLFFSLSLISLLLLTSCDSGNNSHRDLRSSLTFYASFDRTYKADYAKGDPDLYMASSWDRRKEHDLLADHGEYLQIHEGEGKYGDALWIDSRYEPVFFFKGDENMPYDKENWNGTVSFWLRLEPSEDLYPGYSDPIQITASAWNDGAMFVDFTDSDPRIFRFAIFADREVWDPDERDWDDIPVEERPMVDIEDLPFSSDEWTHIVFTFSSFNTGETNGTVHSYVNGEKVGELAGRKQMFTWNPSEVFIWLGYNYRGYFDELSIFNRALTDEEVQNIYRLEKGIREVVGNIEP